MPIRKSRKKMSAKKLEEIVRSIAAEGIGADRQLLKEDMTMQFSDFREWIREYVTNAFDARAKHVRISGWEETRSGTRRLTIVVEDDGHGMDRQAVVDFMMLYRTRKRGKPEQVIGQHGIGKLSVAAIPGQCGFRMVTSTGEECWRLEAGSLLAEKPVKLERISPVPEPGSRFEITFESPNSIQEELVELRRVVAKYVRFLPLDILVAAPADDSQLAFLPVVSDWRTTMGCAGRQYFFRLGGMRYEVTLGIGNGEHELYHNRVLVSTRYNLLSADLAREERPTLEVPYLRVRVDSPDFELPFGRHALRNEEVLGPLAQHLRCKVLPEYLCHVYQEYEAYECYGGEARSQEQKGTEGSKGGADDEVACSWDGCEETAAQHVVPSYPTIVAIALALLKHDARPDRYWSRLPVFVDVYAKRHSLNDLRRAVNKYGVIYLQSGDAVGVDFSVFEAPVLAVRQPPQGLELLSEVVGSRVINLGLADVVLEAPPGNAPPLGPLERRFQQNLTFHRDALALNLRRTERKRNRSGRPVRYRRLPDAAYHRSLGLSQEAERACDDLESLNWRVNYLVGADGKSPSPMRRFLFVGKDVVLNLNHPEVRQLLRLCEKAPALAGHFGLAMVLSDPKQPVLKHLSAEAREDLILVDALAKCGSDRVLRLGEQVHEMEADESPSGIVDFLLNARDDSFSIN